MEWPRMDLKRKSMNNARFSFHIAIYWTQGLPEGSLKIALAFPYLSTIEYLGKHRLLFRNP